MIRVRCKVCSKEVGDFYGDLGCCGCHNLTSVRNGKIIAKDLTKVVIIDSPKKDNKSNKGLPRTLQTVSARSLWGNHERSGDQGRVAHNCRVS